ncbi:MAG: chloride channel protein [Oscillospiraceae bacterium]
MEEKDKVKENPLNREIDIPADTYRSLYFAFGKWLVIALIVGVAVGVTGALFGRALDFATAFRTEHSWLIYLLPLAGLALMFVYRHFGLAEDKGTNTIIFAARSESEVKFRVAPAIFFAAFVTHLFGGSAGREGAALQIGGAVASPFGRLFRLNEHDRAILIMCGMSAGFGALFGTPVAAAIFAVEVTIVAAAQYSALVPCMLSSMTAVITAKLLGVHAESFIVSGVPEIAAENFFQICCVIIVGVASAVVSVLFCKAMEGTHLLYERYIKNPYLRIAAGGTAVALLTFLLRTNDYNGAGMNVIERAMEGEAEPLAFLIKIVFTALTLSCGYKGGEIVPSFFVGATMGCVLGGLIGLDPSFGAAVGMISVFCGVTNCPVAAIVLSVEMFGPEGIGLYALAITISYMLSGYTGLYSAQKFNQSKFRPAKLHIDTK